MTIMDHFILRSLQFFQGNLQSLFFQGPLLYFVTLIHFQSQVILIDAWWNDHRTCLSFFYVGTWSSIYWSSLHCPATGCPIGNSLYQPWLQFWTELESWSLTRVPTMLVPPSLKSKMNKCRPESRTCYQIQSSPWFCFFTVVVLVFRQPPLFKITRVKNTSRVWP